MIRKSSEMHCKRGRKTQRGEWIYYNLQQKTYRGRVQSIYIYTHTKQEKKYTKLSRERVY